MPWQLLPITEEGGVEIPAGPRLVAGARIRAGDAVYLGCDGRVYPTTPEKTDEEWRAEIARRIRELGRPPKLDPASASAPADPPTDRDQ